MKAKAKEISLRERVGEISRGSGAFKSKEILSRGNLRIRMVKIAQMVFLVKTLGSCGFPKYLSSGYYSPLCLAVCHAFLIHH